MDMGAAARQLRRPPGTAISAGRLRRESTGGVRTVLHALRWGVGAVDESSAGAPETARAMAEAATRLLTALTGAQRGMVGFDFADEARRRDWSFLPARRACKGM